MSFTTAQQIYRQQGLYRFEGLISGKNPFKAGLFFATIDSIGCKASFVRQVHHEHGILPAGNLKMKYFAATT